MPRFYTIQFGANGTFKEDEESDEENPLKNHSHHREFDTSEQPKDKISLDTSQTTKELPVENDKRKYSSPHPTVPKPTSQSRNQNADSQTATPVRRMTVMSTLPVKIDTSTTPSSNSSSKDQVEKEEKNQISNIQPKTSARRLSHTPSSGRSETSDRPAIRGFGSSNKYLTQPNQKASPAILRVGTCVSRKDENLVDNHQVTTQNSDRQVDHRSTTVTITYPHPNIQSETVPITDNTEEKLTLNKMLSTPITLGQSVVYPIISEAIASIITAAKTVTVSSNTKLALKTLTSTMSQHTSISSQVWIDLIGYFIENAGTSWHPFAYSPYLKTRGSSTILIPEGLQIKIIIPIILKDEILSIYPFGEDRSFLESKMTKELVFSYTTAEKEGNIIFRAGVDALTKTPYLTPKIMENWNTPLEIRSIIPMRQLIEMIVESSIGSLA